MICLLILIMCLREYNAADNRVSEMYKYPIGCIGKTLDLQIPNLEIMQLFTREIAQNLTGYGGVSDVINMMEEI